MANLDDKELAQYLAELVVNNPQQLLLAFLELMKQRLMLTFTNRLKEVAETSLSQLEKQISRIIDKYG